MDHSAMLREKRISAEEAVKVVRSGDWIDYGFSVGTPHDLDLALAARAHELTDVKVRGGVLMEKPAICSLPDAGEHFTWNSWHLSAVERKMAAEGNVFYCPMRYSELPRFYRENLGPIRAAFLQVAPMDEHGRFSFGPVPSHLAAVCERADYVFVEVNENMPRCLGGEESGIHISRVSGVVQGTNPPVGQLLSTPPTEVDRAVARRIIGEIPDGACLQLGIGGMPNAVGAMIARSDLKDLGVHTEMYVEAYVDIAEAGKLTGAHKALDKGRQVYAIANGTKRLYDYLDNNPACMAAPVDYTNDVRVIARLDNFISINNAVDMDLFGQINAETSGLRHISGAGGQLDFVLGAYLSRGGKSFICMSSTLTGKNGETISRIRPTLAEGTVVTDPRAAVQYLVTEYGMVNLKGTTTWERAERILSVAHPDFREGLIAEAERMHIWRRSNRR